MHTIYVLRDWLDSLPLGTKIQSSAFPGDIFVKRPNGGWDRGQGASRSIDLIAFSLRWETVP